MFGSTTPLAERPDWHPVHRANALLRSALLNVAYGRGLLLVSLPTGA